MHAGLPPEAARIKPMSAVVAVEYEGNLAAGQKTRGVDHGHLAVPRYDAAGHQHDACARKDSPVLAQILDAIVLTAAGSKAAVSIARGMTLTRSGAIV